LSYDGSTAPGVLMIRNAYGASGRTFVRTHDGAQLYVTDQCQMAGANHDRVVMICTTDTLVGNRNLQYVAAYRWHRAAPRSSIRPH
jgi:phosphopantetheine adenylyltransferase